MSVPKFMLCTRSHIYKRCISRNGARNKWKETNIENLLRFILLPLCVVVHGVCLCVCVSMCAHVSSGHTNIHLLFYLGAMEGKRPCPIIANTESEQQQQQKTQKEQIVFVLNFYSVWNWMPIYFGFLFPWKHKEWIDFMDPYRKFDSKYVRVLDVRRHELHESTRNRDNKGNCVITIECLERVNAEQQTNWQRIKNEKVNVTNRKMNILSTQYRFTS